jgi:hypothetical protein
MSVSSAQLAEITKLENVRHKRISLAITRKEQESLAYLRQVSAVASEKVDAANSVLLFAATLRRHNRIARELDGTDQDLKNATKNDDDEPAAATSSYRTSKLVASNGCRVATGGEDVQFVGSRRRSSVVTSSLYGTNSISAQERVQFKIDHYREVRVQQTIARIRAVGTLCHRTRTRQPSVNSAPELKALSKFGVKEPKRQEVESA